MHIRRCLLAQPDHQHALSTFNNNWTSSLIYFSVSTCNLWTWRIEMLLCQERINPVFKSVSINDLTSDVVTQTEYWLFVLNNKRIILLLKCVRPSKCVSSRQFGRILSSDWLLHHCHSLVRIIPAIRNLVFKPRFLIRSSEFIIRE